MQHLISAKPSRDSGQRLVIVSLIAIFAIYLIYSVSLSLTRMPWFDEGQNANPSYDLITRGTSGISVLEESGLGLVAREPLSLKGIQTRNYTQMPLYFALLAGWFKAVGFGLITARLFTVFCGLAVLWAVYLILERLSASRPPALLAIAFLAADYGYVLRTSEVRMDALAAAFGFTGMAVYLYQRESSLVRAMVLSHALVAAAMLTHPNGGMLAFAGLAILTLYHDFRRIWIWQTLLIAIPYLIAGGLWWLYISQDVEAFRVQFFANATHGGRLNSFHSPLETLRQEIVQRYLITLGGWGEAGLKKMKLIIPISYALGVAGILLIAPLRRQPVCRLLLAMIATYFLVLTYTDGRKSQTYLIHIIPLYCAAMAFLFWWIWKTYRMGRLLAVGYIALLYLIHLGGVAYQVRLDAYHKTYLPAIGFLKTATTPSERIMGPAILGFGLMFPSNLNDDIRLGFRSGKTADWIVINEWYSGSFEEMKTMEPEAYQFVKARLERYQPRFSQGTITVLKQIP